MSDIIANSGKPGAALTLVGEEIPFGAYQAVYHKLTKKAERDRKFYRGAYSIEIADIENLNHRLNQAVKQYQTKASRCEVTHAIKNDGTRFHSSFEKFRMTGLTNAGFTSRFSYEFDFLVILPPEIEQASEIAQRFKLTLVLDQYIKDDDDNDYRFYSRSPDIHNIELNIEFSDYTVFQNLRSIVDEWISILPKRDSGLVSKFFQKIEHHFRSLIPPVVFALGLIGAIYTAILNPSLSENDLTRLLILGLLFSFTGATVCDYFSTLMYKFIRETSPVTYLRFTSGDCNREISTNAKRSSLKKIATFMFTVILAGTFVNLFSSYIYELFVTKPS